MRIYLADLCYLNDRDTNNPVPLNIGYIASYLRKQRGSDEVRLFKDPVVLLSQLAQRPPDILALSHYDWNTNLDLAVLARAREIKPDLITVLGGPNFNARDAHWVRDFLLARPDVDAYVIGEGEATFATLVDLIDRYGRIADVPVDARPSTVYSYDRRTDQVIRNPLKPVPRLDLSSVPSPYLNGMLDEFLADPRLVPIVETNRGCPYSCAYCCWGQATQSRINRFPLDVVKAEIDHAARTTTNPSGFFYIADANFGILERDYEIARTIQACTEAYGVPKRLYVYFAKNTTERVVRIAETLSSVTLMSMSKQTLNPTVLGNVKRKNIPVEQYDALRAECERRGIETYSELIYGLAGESDSSFIDGVIATIRQGQRVTMYPQLLLAGAEAGEYAYRQRFGLKTAFRVIPRYVGSFGDVHALEYEEIVVEHDKMSREGYFRIRLFQFLVALLSSQAFQEFNRALRRASLEYGTVAGLMADDRAHWTPAVQSLIEGFLDGARGELIQADQRKLRFTAEDVAGARTRYRALVPYTLCRLASCRETFEGLGAYLTSLVERDVNGLANPAQRQELREALGVGLQKLICYVPMQRERTALHEYDFDAWLGADPSAPLERFRFARPQPFVYRMEEGIADAVEKAAQQGIPLIDAIYFARLNILGTFWGDRVFCYRRVTPAASERDARMSVHRAHADIASR